MPSSSQPPSAVAVETGSPAAATWGQESPGPLLSTIVGPRQSRVTMIIIPVFVVALIAAGALLGLARKRGAEQEASRASASASVSASASASASASVSASASGAPPAASAKPVDVGSLPAAMTTAAKPQSTGKVTPPPGRPAPAKTAAPHPNGKPADPADLPLPTFTASPKPADPPAPPPPTLPE